MYYLYRKRDLNFRLLQCNDPIELNYQFIQKPNIKLTLSNPRHAIMKHFHAVGDACRLGNACKRCSSTGKALSLLHLIKCAMSMIKDGTTPMLFATSPNINLPKEKPVFYILTLTRLSKVLVSILMLGIKMAKMGTLLYSLLIINFKHLHTDPNTNIPIID